MSSSVSLDIIHKCTKDYVQHQSQLSLQSPSSCNGASRFECFEDEPREWSPPAAEKLTLLQNTLRAPIDENQDCAFSRDPESFEFPAQSPRATGYTKTTVNPYSRKSQHSPPRSESPSMLDFAKCLARRELVTTGLTKFDDTLESFKAWQSSFFNAINGLGYYTMKN